MLKGCYDLVCREVTSLQALLHCAERPALEPPVTKYLRCSRQNFIRALENHFCLHTLASDATKIIDSGLI